MPNVRRYERIVRFGTITFVKAGWLIKDKGLWSISEAGLKAFEKHKDPEEFAREADRLYRKWRKEQPEEDGTGAGDTPEPGTTLEEAEEAAWSELELHLSQMNPYDFQNLVAGLLKGMGYHVAWVAPPGPDRGVDIIANSDPLGLNGPRIKVQVKRRADKVDSKEIRSFLALVSEGDVGLYVAMGGFTKDAEEEARYQEKRRLMLVDSRRLIDLWIQNYERIPDVSRRHLPLRAVYFLDSED